MCTALHNYLLQSLIDMRSGNCENEWRSQPFVLLLLLEKYMRMLHEYFRLLYFIYGCVICKCMVTIIYLLFLNHYKDNIDTNMYY